MQTLLKERGDDWRDLLKTYIAAVNAVVAGAPSGMTIGVHICRSQDPTWQADIGYDPIAEPLFNDIAFSMAALPARISSGVGGVQIGCHHVIAIPHCAIAHFGSRSAIEVKTRRASS